MKQTASILIALKVLVISLSLSLQYVFKTYFCEDTKAYVEIAGKKITICGKTCDFEYKQNMHDSADGISFDFKAPPLFFEVIDTEFAFAAVKNCIYSEPLLHYHYQSAAVPWQPPRI